MFGNFKEDFSCNCQTDSLYLRKAAINKKVELQPFEQLEKHSVVDIAGSKQ